VIRKVKWLVKQGVVGRSAEPAVQDDMMELE